MEEKKTLPRGGRATTAVACSCFSRCGSHFLWVAALVVPAAAYAGLVLLVFSHGLWFTAEAQLQFSSGHRHLVRVAEADHHRPDYPTDHGGSTVVVRILWSMFPFCGPCFFSGAAVEKTFVPVVQFHRCMSARCSA